MCLDKFVQFFSQFSIYTFDPMLVAAQAQAAQAAQAHAQVQMSTDPGFRIQVNYPFTLSLRVYFNEIDV